MSIVGILHADVQTRQLFSFRRQQFKAGGTALHTRQLPSFRGSRREGGQAAHQHHSTLTPKSQRPATTHADAKARREGSAIALPPPTCSRSRPNCGESAVGSRCTSPAIALTTSWWYGISPAWQAEGESMLVCAGGMHGHLCVSTLFFSGFTQLCCIGLITRCITSSQSTTHITAVHHAHSDVSPHPTRTPLARHPPLPASSAELHAAAPLC